MTTIRFDAPIDAATRERVRKIVAASSPHCVAYFDIDGTLVTEDGEPDMHVLALLKWLHDQNVRIFLWSAGGDENCRRVARLYGITEMIEAYLPKPVISVDDMRYDDYVFVKLHPSDLAPKG